jgi:hypothetical protein
MATTAATTATTNKHSRLVICKSLEKSCSISLQDTTMNSPFVTIAPAKHNSRPKPGYCFKHLEGADKLLAATTRPTVLAATAPTSSRCRCRNKPPRNNNNNNDMSVTRTNKTLPLHKATTTTTTWPPPPPQQSADNAATTTCFTSRARSPIH